MNITNIGLRLFEGCGEAPCYDSVKDELYLVNIPDISQCNHHGRIFRKILSNTTADFESYDTGSINTSFVVPTKDDKLLVGLHQSIVEVDWPRDGTSPSHTVMHSVDEGKPTYFSDGKCDRQGRLVTATLSTTSVCDMTTIHEVGSLYGVDTDRSIRIIDDEHQYSISNGLAWTSDGQKLFFIDSMVNTVYVFDYDPNNFTAENRRVFFDMAAQDNPIDGLLDGCCIDSNDNLWAVVYNSGRVICIDTKTGQIVNEIKFPTKCITSCCFAGPHLNELIVTSDVAAQDEEGGSLFRVTNVGAKGVPTVVFNG